MIRIARPLSSEGKVPGEVGKVFYKTGSASTQRIGGAIHAIDVSLVGGGGALISEWRLSAVEICHRIGFYHRSVFFIKVLYRFGLLKDFVNKINNFRT